MGRALWMLSLEQWRGTGSHVKNDNVSFTSLAKDVCSDVTADDIKQHKWLVSAVDWNSSSSLCSLWWLSMLILSEWGMKYIQGYTQLGYFKVIWGTCDVNICASCFCAFFLAFQLCSQRKTGKGENKFADLVLFRFWKERVPHCLSRGKHKTEAHFHLHQQGRDQLNWCK